MKDVYLLIEQNDKSQRQEHLRLEEPCLERGGCSTNHKGILAEYLNTNIPRGTKIYLCHACHNGKCSNPRHLYWGTAKENVEDTIQNGNFTDISKYVGHLHTEETKRKISSSLKGRPSNNRNGINGSNTGKSKIGYPYKRKYKQIWINNGLMQTRIKACDNIPEGYSKGRLK